MFKVASLQILTLDLLKMDEDLFLSKVNEIIQNSLSVLESHCHRKLILPAQRGLLLFSKSNCELDVKIDELKNAFNFLNEQSDNNYLGFSQLLETMYEEIDLTYDNSSVNVEFGENDASSALENTILALEILFDIVESFGIEADAIFASLVLDAIFYESVRLLADKSNLNHIEKILQRWVNLSSCSIWLKLVWPLRHLVYEISPQVCSKLANTKMHQLYCVWFLVNRLVNQKPIEGFTRNLLDTLLQRAEMAPLVVFENAGLIP